MVVFLAKVNVACSSSHCHGNATLSVQLDVKMLTRLNAALKI